MIRSGTPLGIQRTPGVHGTLPTTAMIHLAQLRVQKFSLHISYICHFTTFAPPSIALRLHLLVGSSSYVLVLSCLKYCPVTAFICCFYTILVLNTRCSDSPLHRVAQQNPVTGVKLGLCTKYIFARWSLWRFLCIYLLWKAALIMQRIQRPSMPTFKDSSISKPTLFPTPPRSHWRQRDPSCMWTWTWSLTNLPSKHHFRSTIER